MLRHPAVGAQPRSCLSPGSAEHNEHNGHSARRCGRGRGRAQLCLLYSYLSHAGSSSGCRVPRGCRCHGTATHIVLLRLQRGTFNGYFREATAPNGAFLFSARAALGSDGFFLSPPCCTAPLIARTVLLSCTRQKASPPPSQRAARCCFPGWPGSLHDGELFVNKAMCASRSHGAVQQGCAPGSYLLSPYLCVQQSWAASREHFQEQQFSPPRAVPHGCQLQSLPSHSALLLPGSVTLASSTVLFMLINGANLPNEESFILPFIGNLLLQQPDDPVLPSQHMDVQVDDG